MNDHLSATFRLFATLNVDPALNAGTVQMIGSVAHPFTGVFNGNGNSIQNLHITSTSTGPVALFPQMNGTVEYLTISGAVISGSSASTIGAIAGNLNGTIKGCNVGSGSIGNGTYGVAVTEGILTGGMFGTRQVNAATLSDTNFYDFIGYSGGHEITYDAYGSQTGS
jgi:hypothetical protein